MTAGLTDPLNNDPTVRRVINGSARWAAATVLVAGTLLQVVEFLLENPTDDTAARVKFWTEQPTQVGLSMACGLLAVPFLLGGIAVLVTLTRAYSPRLAWTAGALLTLAMVGLAAAHGYELAAYALTLSGNSATAASLLNGDNLGLPGAVMLVMFLGGAVLGTLTMAAAVWRSPLVPRIAALFMVAFAALDFALGQGVVSHLMSLIGWTIVAGGVVVGYSRSPRKVSS